MELIRKRTKSKWNRRRRCDTYCWHSKFLTRHLNSKLLLRPNLNGWWRIECNSSVAQHTQRTSINACVYIDKSRVWMHWQTRRCNNISLSSSPTRTHPTNFHCHRVCASLWADANERWANTSGISYRASIRKFERTSESELFVFVYLLWIIVWTALSLSLLWLSSIYWMCNCDWHLLVVRRYTHIRDTTRVRCKCK